MKAASGIMDHSRRALWCLAGTIFLAIGLIGAVVPLMPTTVFLILAAACFARGSERAHHWLTHHRLFGPSIRDWFERGAIGRKAKIFACLSLLAMLAPTLFLGAPLWVIGVQAAVILGVGGFIVTRPE